MSIDWNQIIIAIIPAVGVVAGVGLNEGFKLKERKALFAEVIFKKKLELYEELFQRLITIREEAKELINNSFLSNAQQGYQTWSDVVLSFASFLDKNELYLDENIGLHAMASIIGVEKILEMNEAEREKRIKDFNEDIKRAIEMIKDDIGVKRLENFFGRLNKPVLKSIYTEYVEKLKREN